MTTDPTSRPRQRPIPIDDGQIALPPLVNGTLIARYKRFLADVRLSDGRMVTVHCPNSGRMTSCSEPGRRVYLSHHDRPGRKYPWSWELIAMPDSLVGINTLLPNRLVAASAAAGCITELAGYTAVRREVSVGKRSRLDLMFTGPDLPACYVEVKNCTWVRDGVARFPDAVTARGLKHMDELAALAADGHRAVIFFVVQRMDAHRFEPAGDVDPAYARGLSRAVAGGVEIAVYDTRITPTAIGLGRALPWRW